MNTNQNQASELPVIVTEVLDDMTPLYSRTGDIKDFNTLLITREDLETLKNTIAALWEVSKTEFQ